MRKSLLVAALLVLPIAACKKTGENEYQVKTPDVNVSTDSHTVRTPDVDVGTKTPDALVYDQGRVPDGVFAALREGLSDEEILELTYITAMYSMHAVITRALRLIRRP